MHVLVSIVFKEVSAIKSPIILSRSTPSLLVSATGSNSVSLLCSVVVVPSSAITGENNCRGSVLTPLPFRLRFLRALLVGVVLEPEVGVSNKEDLIKMHENTHNNYLRHSIYTWILLWVWPFLSVSMTIRLPRHCLTIQLFHLRSMWMECHQHLVL